MLTFTKSMLELDSSKITDYMQCPRYFFYRHICGWRAESTSHDLVFGSAWHLAMEYLLINGFHDGWIEAAMVHFLGEYRKSFAEITDLDMYPKSPAGARESLMLYETMYGQDMGFDIVSIGNRPATEIYGTVPIAADRRVQFKIDAIGDIDGMKAFMDHKTTKSDNPLYQSIYTLSNQMNTYYHALCSLMGKDNIYGGVVNLSMFRKKGHHHMRIPIKKTAEMLNEWLHNVNNWYTMIEDNVSSLFNKQEDLVEQEAMSVFPRCDKGCTAYFRSCSYFDLCTVWANPLQRTDDPPPGMHVEFWSPRDEATEKGKEYVEV